MIKLSTKRLLKVLKRSAQWFIIIIVWLLYVALHLAMLVVPFWIIIFPLLILAYHLYVYYHKTRYINKVTGNVIIHGGRGKGKGLLFQKAINETSSALCNMEYGHNVTVLEPETYFNSIAPNTSETFVKKEYKIVQKRYEWERKPYFLDDTSVYFPNYNDTLLKKMYPSMSLMIPIQRHLYNSYTVINVQDIERVYKILRELQTDGYIKALNTIGTGYIAKRLPYLRRVMIVKYRYHENLDSAINNRLPFEKMGILQKATDVLYTTTPSALKEAYEGQNGIIKDGFIVIKRKHIKYDTRYFHKVIFGESPIDIA